MCNCGCLFYRRPDIICEQLISILPFIPCICFDMIHCCYTTSVANKKAPLLSYVTLWEIFSSGVLCNRIWRTDRHTQPYVTVFTEVKCPEGLPLKRIWVTCFRVTHGRPVAKLPNQTWQLLMVAHHEWEVKDTDYILCDKDKIPYKSFMKHFVCMLLPYMICELWDLQNS